MNSESTQARERVLAAAERLFAQKGYGPITLRQIGAEAGIDHSSLYHHVPKGKEQLFVEVMERIFQRHRIGITSAIQQAPADIRNQLYAVADWLLAQPPMDLVRMEHIDMLNISSTNMQHLTQTAYVSLQVPIEEALAAAQERSQIQHDDFSLISGGLVGMIESLFAVSEQVAGKSRQTMAYRLIDVLLDGLRPR
jgi:AcrR family transcriptional regulator